MGDCKLQAAVGVDENKTEEPSTRIWSEGGGSGNDDRCQIELSGQRAMSNPGRTRETLQLTFGAREGAAVVSVN